MFILWYLWSPSRNLFTIEDALFVFLSQIVAVFLKGLSFSFHLSHNLIFLISFLKKKLRIILVTERV